MAWQRTALSVVVAAAVVSRVAYESLGPVSVLAFVADLPALASLVVSRRGERRGDGRAPQASELATLSVGIVAIAAVELLAVFARG